MAGRGVEVPQLMRAWNEERQAATAYIAAYKAMRTDDGVPVETAGLERLLAGAEKRAHSLLFEAVEQDRVVQHVALLRAKRMLYDACFQGVSGLLSRNAVSKADAGAMLEAVQQVMSELSDEGEALTLAVAQGARRVMATALPKTPPAAAKALAAGAGAAVASPESVAALFPSASSLESSAVAAAAAAAAPAAAAGSAVAAAAAGSAAAAAAAAAAGTSPPAIGPREDLSGRRKLSRRQLLETIDAVYATKAKSDKRCLAAAVPMETMAQHLITHLNQRFGLKQLITDWADAILRGVEAWADSICEVAVFRLTLRNELDEGYRTVHKQLAASVVELLRAHVRSRHPTLSEAALEHAIRARIDGYVTEEEWVDIVRYMYTHEDSAALIKRVKAHASAHSAALAATAAAADTPSYASPILSSVAATAATTTPFTSSAAASASAVSTPPASSSSSTAAAAPTPSPSARALTEGRVPFAAFLEVVQFRDLRRHQQTLEPLVRTLHETEPATSSGSGGGGSGGGAGVVSEDHFRHACARLNPALQPKETDALFEALDVSGARYLTFSQCLAAVSRELGQLVAHLPRRASPAGSGASAGGGGGKAPAGRRAGEAGAGAGAGTGAGAGGGSAAKQDKLHGRSPNSARRNRT
mmetsp:Transcript_799/g.2920  ORF Transcript_799/g.2920 Transcript_799/m.2920 type:complete len:644 (-) Transcript_799:12-1943(-)